VIQRDVDSVRRAVQKALADPSKLTEMGRAAREAAELYSPEAFVERWRMLYGRLLVDVAPAKRVPA
jgi:glycosyltransferase involved in cell wall biosynthesis